MKYFSTFSGVEGFGQGFPKDWECVGFSEVDKYASMVLKYHFPNVKNYGDITKIKWEEIADFDILTGGSPCQDFSIAGKRRGLGGSRSSLAWEYIRCLWDKKPRYFIWENVKGVMSSRGGWDFANILTAFSESGYALWWQVLNAKDFGVPQNRERIFVVGVRDGNPKEVFFEREDSKTVDELQGYTNNLTTRYQALGTGTYVIENKLNAQIKVRNKGASQHYRIYDEGGVAPTLQSQSGFSSQKHPFVMFTERRTEEAKELRRKGIVKDTRSLKKLMPRGDDLANTITAVSEDKNRYMTDGNKIRKLMPIECERLMSWQDDWTRWGINEKGNKVEISDSQRYKMCGNGVVSNVVRELAKVLFKG